MLRLKVIVDNEKRNSTRLVVEKDGVVIGTVPGVQHIAWSTDCEEVDQLTTISFRGMRIEGAPEQVGETEQAE